MEWVLAHMEDADFNDPLPAPAAAAGAAAAPASAKAADPDSLAMLTGMGFTSEQVSSREKFTNVLVRPSCATFRTRLQDWAARDLPISPSYLSGLHCRIGTLCAAYYAILQTS